MIPILRTWLTILLLLGSGAPAAAQPEPTRWGIAAAGGDGALGQRHDSWRLSVQRHWNLRWWQHPAWHFTGYWDLGLTRWDASEVTAGSQDRGAARIHALGLGPVVRWQFEPFGNSTIAPFLELGVGFSLLSDSSLRSGNRRSLLLGSHWQFEDRGVIGVRVGRQGRFEVAYQRMHHSNLNLASDNHGVDSHLLMIGYRF